MDFVAVFPVITLAAGSGLTMLGGWLQQRQAASTRRDEREWEARQRLLERDEKRRADEIEGILELYGRASLVGMDYRSIEEGSADQAERWKKFEPLFHAVKAELFLRAGSDIAQAFASYVDETQAVIAEEDHHGYERGRDGWEHHDPIMEKLLAFMRSDIDERWRTERQREKIATQTPTTTMKARTPGTLPPV
jgi:hypothetical protein